MKLDAESKLDHIQHLVQGIESYVKSIPLGKRPKQTHLTVIAYLALGFSITGLIRQEFHEHPATSQEINIDSPEAVKVLVEELLRHERIQGLLDNENAESEL